MTEQHDVQNKLNLWLRGFYMLIMTFVFQLAITVMLVVAVIQFVLTLLNGTANDRLVILGGKLGRYLQQISNFLTFASEEKPFPFNDWPSEA